MRRGSLRPAGGSSIPTDGDLLAKVSVDMMSTGTTLLYQPAAGKKVVITRILMITTLYNAPNNNAQVDIGNNSPNYDNVVAFVNYSTSLIAVDNFYTALLLDANYFGNNDLITNSNPLYLNIPTADDGTAEEIDFIIYGYEY